MKFTIQRWHESTLVHEVKDLCHDHAKGIVLLVWGMLPNEMEDGGEVGKEWKLSFGGGHWVIIARTA